MDTKKEEITSEEQGNPGTVPTAEKIAHDVAGAIRDMSAATQTDVMEMMRSFDIDSIKLDVDRIDFDRLRSLQEKFTIDKDAIKARILESLKPGSWIVLTDEDKQLIEDLTRHAFAEILDIEAEKITRESHLVDDLGMDSLAFLEMFDEMKEYLDLEIDVNVVARYAQEYPVSTFGEYLDQMYNFIEARDKILEELGIDREEVIQRIEQVIHKVEQLDEELSGHLAAKQSNLTEG